MGRNCCFFGASTCLVRNWMEKSFFKELSNITAIEWLALVGLSPPQQGAASQPRCSFRSSTAARAGFAPSQGPQERATWLPRSSGQDPTFSCCRRSGDSSPLLIPVQQLCRPPRRADALQPPPKLQGRDRTELGIFLLSQHNPQTHTENILKSSCCFPCPTCRCMGCSQEFRAG